MDDDLEGHRNNHGLFYGSTPASA